MKPYHYYSVLLAGLLFGPVDAAELSLESGPGRFGDLVWSGIALAYRPAGDDPGWRLSVSELGPVGEAPFGDVTVICERPEASPPPHCKRGRLEWRGQRPAMTLSANLTIEQQDEDWQFELVEQGWAVRASVSPQAPDALRASLQLDELALAPLRSLLSDELGLAELDGLLSGRIEYADSRLTGRVQLDQGLIDSVDGLYAAEGLALELEGWADLARRELGGRLIQRAGEALLGSLYLPPPEPDLRLEWQLAEDDGFWRVSEFRLDDGDALRLEGSADLAESETGWRPTRIELERLEVDLARFWPRWADGPAAAAGFPGLAIEGTLEGRLAWLQDQAPVAELLVSLISAIDPAERLALSDLVGRLTLGADGASVALDWGGLALYGLPFGAARLRLGPGTDGGIQLAEPLRLPLLDGAVVIDRFGWLPDDEAGAGVELDARLEPVDLADLTRLFGWPEFGGTVAGFFPGIVYRGQRLDFTGDIDIHAFSGAIRLSGLAVERPFGTLPAVAAQLEFQRLDLLDLTGAFNFGRMEGQVSGWARNLRLLDWRPVAMDARLFTHEDVRRRRISQRAVNNLSSLGGAGGALLSGTVLRVFEDFPYRRAGLACRLANNICQIDGVAPHDSGGFYIVEGRSLPRLDVIGHRRLVDWPQLLRQLEAMLEER